MSTDKESTNESGQAGAASGDIGSDTGEPITPSDETEAEKDRINSLTDPRDDAEISFYQYTDDSGVFGYRMELSTDGHQVVPADITAITENTQWNFTGCKNGAVMFEAGDL